MRQKGLSLLLALAVLCSLSIPAKAVDESAVDAAASDTASYLCNLVKSPQVGSIGGEWAVLGLARGECGVPDSYYQDYYATVEEYVRARKGVLAKKKYTEYSRVVVALTAIGKDPTDVAGYNLLTPLGDYDRTIWQGLNGPIWALIALDSGNYAMPVDKDAKTQATRQKYLDRILACQLPDGGWSLFGGTAAAASGGGTSDPDITGMALQALAKYQDQAAVKKATGEALTCMSKQQRPDGGFASWGAENSESCAQMIVALTELGIPLDDARFVKNGRTMADNLLTFYRRGAGFLHTADGSGSNQMATEQGLYGLVAIRRAAGKENSLYRMSDAISVGACSNAPAKGEGLAGRNTDVKPVAVTHPGATFSDIGAHKNQPAIEALAARGIVTGKTAAAFEPDAGMTRAQFTAVVVRALGLTPVKVTKFTDVKPADWCAGYVGTAYTYGIVNGTTETEFSPDGAITRQQAAAMVARAAGLCGMDTAYPAAAARDVLSQFPDYVKCSAFAFPGLAFCYDKGILDSSARTIQPQKKILRCEVAQMLYNLLSEANLL
jgi:hypothetical protein